jgi:hypothetical protein
MQSLIFVPSILFFKKKLTDIMRYGGLFVIKIQWMDMRYIMDM